PLPEGLIAVVGDNGAGKSHVLELSGPATIYREFSSYGEGFASHVATGVRDAFSDLVFSIDGAKYRALVQCDPQFGGGKGKTEAFLMRESAPGEWAPIAGPLVKDFDAAIARILPSRELFLASVF